MVSFVDWGKNTLEGHRLVQMDDVYSLMQGEILQVRTRTKGNEEADVCSLLRRRPFH